MKLEHLTEHGYDQCVEFLQGVDTTKTVNQNAHHIGGLKHILEDVLHTYISSDDCYLACKDLNIPMKSERLFGTPGALIVINKRSFKRRVNEYASVTKDINHISKLLHHKVRYFLMPEVEQYLEEKIMVYGLLRHVVKSIECEDTH